MRSEFSEFSFGFAFTHEYVNHTPGLEAAPELPSLILEAEKGYDLKLDYAGHPKFFQFKLADYLTRRNALHWNHHGEPHYRVSMTTRVRPNQTSDTSQHTLLKRLAENVENVYYIAPTFHTSEEFNEHFTRQSVTANSLWAPLDVLPCATDNDVHYLTFTEHCVSPTWHSEPIPLEGKFTAEEHYAATQETVQIDENYFRQLRDKLINALEASQLKVQQSSNSSDEIVDVLKDIYSLLTSYFGLQMVTLVRDGV